MANIYDFPLLSVKWYCNCDRRSEDLLHHLHCYILGNTLQYHQQKYKAKSHNLKWYLFRWNSKSFELLFTYIHHSLASLSVLFIRKSWSFVNSSLFLHHVSIFLLERLYKLAFTSGIFLKKVSLIYENLFPIPLFCNLKYISFYFIQNGMKSSCK